MLPDAAHPERGSFVRDQVAALRAPRRARGRAARVRPRRARARAARRASCAAATGRRRRSPAGPPRARFDVVHAHFGLTAWPALAVPARVRALTVHGTDVRHPRTRLATAAVLRAIDLLAAVSAPLVQELPGAPRPARALVLPCGVDLERFPPLPRAQARAELGLDPERPLPAVRRRPRARRRSATTSRSRSRARSASSCSTLGGVEPEHVPLWVNAANAVLVPSEREGFGLAVLEALACDVPVLATPVGIHAEALARRRRHAVRAVRAASAGARRSQPHLRARTRACEGRARAARFSRDGDGRTRARTPGARRSARSLSNGRVAWIGRGQVSASAGARSCDAATPPRARTRPAAPPSRPASSRGARRRRARFLRKARELAYRDLGGLVFNLHRFGQRNDALVLAKLTTLGHIDAELRALESTLARAPAGHGAARGRASPPALAARRSTAARTASAPTAGCRWAATPTCRTRTAPRRRRRPRPPAGPGAERLQRRSARRLPPRARDRRRPGRHPRPPPAPRATAAAAATPSRRPPLRRPRHRAGRPGQRPAHAAGHAPADRSAPAPAPHAGRRAGRRRSDRDRAPAGARVVSAAAASRRGLRRRRASRALGAAGGSSAPAEPRRRARCAARRCTRPGLVPALRRRRAHAPGGDPELEGPADALAVVVAVLPLGVLAAALVKLAGGSGPAPP